MRECLTSQTPSNGDFSKPSLIGGQRFLTIILLLLSNRALYWFTAVGSETVFYSIICYKLPDWLFPRSYCYFPPKPPDTLCVPISYCYFLPKPPDTRCVSCDQSASIVSFSLSVSLEHVKAINYREITCAYFFSKHEIIRDVG